MKTRTSLPLIMVCIFLVILALNNSMVYLSTKRMLIRDLDERMQSIADQVRTSIDMAHFGSEFVEQLLAENLRSAAIAVQFALDPDIENVTNEQLIRLRDLLGVKDITLFKQTEDDIVGYRSSDPKELNMSTKNWAYWYEAFQQLLAREPVDVGKGQTLPDFWAGPFEYATSNPANLDKWGYYYDGSTNYIIDPYIGNDKIERYEQEVGTPAVLDSLLENNPFLIEITVFNHAVFGKEPVISVNANHETWVNFARRPVLYGTYEYANMDLDIRHLREAMRTGTEQTYTASINGRQVYKRFIPVAEAEIPYVIGIVSDYETIQAKLQGQFRYATLTIVAASLISAGLIVIGTRLIRLRKDSAVQAAQETYIQNVNDLFTAIRGQRHDFLNQVQTIHTMASMGKTEDLKRFTRELIEDIQEINDIIRIGNPAIASLVQAKIVSAVDKKIDFQYEIDDLQDVRLGVRSVDIVKIIGNLVDNAFDEVAGLPEGNRHVRLKVYKTDRVLHIKTSNPGRHASDEEIRRWFEPGYSTRADDKHDGIGLAIAKERVERCKGSITAGYTPEEGIVFHVTLPLD